ncbi:MAG: glycerophosphodiester phosphodiesterase family protein [Clostridia bacterium]|nr:glycerophosphodiester phosphodiesterase family protein [Clostridia bacterium]
MAFDNLKKDAAERIIIAAHRGECGGNIPCNTITAYEIAVSHGADMIEVDVSRSAEGTLWILHPKMEPRHLNYMGPEGMTSIWQLTDEQIRKLRYVNYDRDFTQFPLCTFDEVLERFKGRAYINVDKFWENPRLISDAIRAHGMIDQIVVKSSPKPEYLDIIEEYAPEICYLPILTHGNENVHGEMLRRNINYVGAEVVFQDETKDIGTTDFIDLLHSDGKLVWANAIIYNYKKQLAAGHSDDPSFTVSPDYGWGWLADRGYDIIQTDWTQAMAVYLEQTGKRYLRK